MLWIFGQQQQKESIPVLIGSIGCQIIKPYIYGIHLICMHSNSYIGSSDANTLLQSI